MLWDDGVRWDITAVHWYSNQGNIEKAGCRSGANVAAIDASFGKPVWITEFNSNTAAADNDEEAAAAWITQFMQ
jgi:Glycosyl hydrolase catalytic core